jgi:hypothetical protein
MSAIKKDIRKTKHILTTKNRLRKLPKNYTRNRPSQIAEQLHITVQNVNYYTTILTDLKLIEKLSDRGGISWKVAERGLFILKQFLRGSVNSYHNTSNNSPFYDARIPVRLHDICFAFKVTSSLEDLKIRWKVMKNGVSRYTIIKRNGEERPTADLIKSPYPENSRMLIHLDDVYTFNTFQEIIRLYEAARTAAVLIADELNIGVSTTGVLVKRPHLAFEGDLIALYLATFETASIKTKSDKGRVWVDASHGAGELEINDPDYAYKYLTMPENVFDLSKDIRKIESKISGYKRCYDPIITENN